MISQQLLSKDFIPNENYIFISSSQNVLENPVRGDEAPQPVLDFMQENLPAESTLATSTAWHKTIRMIYVRSNPKVAVGHWPIPESFWPDPGAQAMVNN